MKSIALILLAASVVALVGWRLASPKPSLESSLSASSRPARIPPSTTNTDGAEVFQRAFWKRPAANDSILNAERREWKDADGVTRWQWFIAVKPSPELVKHLITDNAFHLAPATTVPDIEEPPAWFAPEKSSSRILRAPGSGMTLLFDEASSLLLATDSGGGFRQGAPEPAKPVAQNTAVTSRLPNSPPPKP
ncbi:MAG: hypothetical protein IAE77_00875 [Prosthecobacter sp.]|jgi:hypothetical protein|uniref:hypothetical protein n=1 Tax=Prosthecobacter sp. TaxID=1965333 RepID=UPI0019DE749C|nr:hypothetical protein [Prosthecobacter sp.]MBE2281992.1 hypothetical protein [Prosthecobacter sp.]